MISSSALVSLLVAIFIAGLICYLLWWLIGFIGLPDPFAKVARAIIAVVAVLFLINVLLQVGGMTPLVRIG